MVPNEVLPAYPKSIKTSSGPRKLSTIHNWLRFWNFQALISALNYSNTVSISKHIYLPAIIWLVTFPIVLHDLEAQTDQFFHSELKSGMVFESGKLPLPVVLILPLTSHKNLNMESFHCVSERRMKVLINIAKYNEPLNIQ